MNYPSYTGTLNLAASSALARERATRVGFQSSSAGLGDRFTLVQARALHYSPGPAAKVQNIKEKPRRNGVSRLGLTRRRDFAANSGALSSPALGAASVPGRVCSAPA